MFALVITSHHGCGRLPLTNGCHLLGRSPRCQLLMNEPTVSRQHAQLTVSDSEIQVTDLGSANGTWVDDERIGSAVVVEGQRLSFGTAHFVLARLSHSEEDSNPSTAPAPIRPSAQATQQVNIDGLLSPAQRRVFALLVAGLPEKQIATKLGSSEHTIHNHMRAICARFDVHTRAELMAYLLRRG